MRKSPRMPMPMPDMQRVPSLSIPITQQPAKMASICSSLSIEKEDITMYESTKPCNIPNAVKQASRSMVHQLETLEAEEDEEDEDMQFEPDLDFLSTPILLETRDFQKESEEVQYSSSTPKNFNYPSRAEYGGGSWTARMPKSQSDDLMVSHQYGKLGSYQGEYSPNSKALSTIDRLYAHDTPIKSRMFRTNLKTIVEDENENE